MSEHLNHIPRSINILNDYVHYSALNDSPYFGHILI